MLKLIRDIYIQAHKNKKRKKKMHMFLAKIDRKIIKVNFILRKIKYY